MGVGFRVYMRSFGDQPYVRDLGPALDTKKEAEDRRDEEVKLLVGRNGSSGWKVEKMELNRTCLLADTPVGEWRMEIGVVPEDSFEALVGEREEAS